MLAAWNDDQTTVVCWPIHHCLRNPRQHGPPFRCGTRFAQHLHSSTSMVPPAVLVSCFTLALTLPLLFALSLSRFVAFAASSAARARSARARSSGVSSHACVARHVGASHSAALPFSMSASSRSKCCVNARLPKISSPSASPLTKKSNLATTAPASACCFASESSNATSSTSCRANRSVKIITPCDARGARRHALLERVASSCTSDSSGAMAFSALGSAARMRSRQPALAASPLTRSTSPSSMATVSSTSVSRPASAAMAPATSSALAMAALPSTAFKRLREATAGPSTASAIAGPRPPGCGVAAPVT
mmetsp:Transcript_77376/g.250348  ORF Transcript_77376/g.250348 Transcript_77376/m.250348 type:complete len:308 (+) Transcript_77376:40-963(+)